MRRDVRFFSISSGLYFPGFVGMLNSLRAVGHSEPVTVLERGMSRSQRAVLEPHCTVVSRPERVANPCHLTAYPHTLGFEGIAVFIDADALVLRRLDGALAEAANGRICMFRDPDDARFFPEWAEIFGLSAPLRTQPYYNTGFVCVSTEAWPTLLERWWETLARIWARPSFMEGAAMREDPTSQPDQDALNALLMSELPEGAVHELDARMNVFPGRLPDVELPDPRHGPALLDGREVSLVQCSGSPKPWTWGALRQRRNAHAFLPLLRRALVREDATVRPPRRHVPPWLWRGRLGELAYRVAERAPTTSLRRLPADLVRRVASRPRES